MMPAIKLRLIVCEKLPYIYTFSPAHSTVFSLSSHLFLDNWVVSRFELWWIVLQKNKGKQMSFINRYFGTLAYLSRSWIATAYRSLIFMLFYHKFLCCFPKRLNLSPFPPAIYEVSSTHIYNKYFYMWCILVLILISLMIRNKEHFIIYIYV